jgi:hypothetical protein
MSAPIASTDRLPPNRVSGDTFANGKGIDWPLCDLCGAVMTAEASEPHVIRFACENDDFTISFASCRNSDRYCAWRMAHPIKGVD